MPPTGHSPLGASSAHRWLNCPGSVALSEGIPSKSSSYAQEGTAAHLLAEECIRRDVSPYSYVNGGTVTIEDDDGNQIEYEVSANMAEAVMVYVQRVKELCTRLELPPEIEKRFHLDWIDDALYGTNDFSISLPFDTLHVWDYKHGQGVPVDVVTEMPSNYSGWCVVREGVKLVPNSQLMYYALGALGEKNEHFVANVELGIIQPRATHSGGPVRLFKMTLVELMDWRDSVLVPGIAGTKEQNAVLCAGKHCKFCPALSICPEVVKEAANVSGLTAKQVFEVGPVKKPVFPEAKTLTVEQRVRLYQFLELFESWIKTVKSDTHDQMMSGHKMSLPDGTGLKLVAGRASRKWADEKTAQKEVIQLIGEENAYANPAFKSPAQVEKELKKAEIGNDAITHLITTSRSESVALESDSRPPVIKETASEVFTTT